jgi:two-component system chemotaxis response regulator CheB
MSAAPVRVAICDDSHAYGVGLGRFLETDHRLKVVTIATSAEQLLGSLAEMRPDLITMDLALPGIDGVEAVRLIMASTPVPIVVISAYTNEGDGRVPAALAAGARHAMAKADVGLDRRLSPRAVALRQRLVRLVRDQARRGPSSSRPAPPHPGPAEGPGERPPPSALPRTSVATVVGVAASAGGPAALREILTALPADFRLPVLVVQHISEGFAATFAAWLDGLVAPPVRLARDGEPLGRGIFVAPDGADLVVAPDRRLRLDRTSAAGAHRPSADALLRSLAAVAGRGVVAVVLTGLGRDGAAGVAAVREAGGVALAEQDAALSGMPGAATEAGATPLVRREISRALVSLSGGRHGR